MYQTFILIKPDRSNDPKAVQEIFQYFKNNHLQVRHVKRVVVTQANILKHYAQVIEEHSNPELFTRRIIQDFVGKEVVIATLKGKGNVIPKVRKLVGATQPCMAEKGTIRARFGQHDSYALANEQDRCVNNVIHASDAESAVLREMNIWY